MDSIKNTAFFSSWSGGKDSCLALYHALKQGAKPSFLLTMLEESGRRSRAHGLPLELLSRQARSLQIPLTTRAATWDGYEAAFISVLQDFKAKGVQVGVFGDIDLLEHLQWCEKVCAKAHMQPFHPLWKRARRDILEEFIGLGFKAVIIAIKESRLGRDFLGQSIDLEMIKALEAAGIDPAGEEGEYHTVVTDGPLFSEPIQLQQKEQAVHDGYRFLEVT